MASFARTQLVSCVATTSRRPFSMAAARYAGKESALGSETRTAEIEAAKKETLQAQKEGRGKWTEDLASDSESSIKADRDEAGTTKERIEKLQEEAKKVAQK